MAIEFFKHVHENMKNLKTVGSVDRFEMDCFNMKEGMESSDEEEMEIENFWMREKNVLRKLSKSIHFPEGEDIIIKGDI